MERATIQSDLTKKEILPQPLLDHYLALSRISTIRQRLSFDSGRVS